MVREWNGIPGLHAGFYELSLSHRVRQRRSSRRCIGTLLALALVRYRFRGQGLAQDQVMFMNIAAPEIVLGASLLGFFVTINLPAGSGRSFLAHVMFCIAYVAITVRARMAGFDRSLEEAAPDLGAGRGSTFRKITLPLILPGVLAGACWRSRCRSTTSSSRTSSAGTTRRSRCGSTGAVRVGIPPQVFVFGRLSSWRASGSRC